MNCSGPNLLSMISGAAVSTVIIITLFAGLSLTKDYIQLAVQQEVQEQ